MSRPAEFGSSDDRRRVMHVITPSRMAGAETFLTRLLRRSDARQVANHCVTSGRPVEEMRAAGMTFETLGIRGKLNPLAVPRLRAAARRFDADLLHSHLSTASWWCGWLERFGGPPSIGHVHGFTSAAWHRRQTHLIACSAAVKADLVAKGIPADRVTTLHYPVDPGDQQPKRTAAQVRAELGVAAGVPVIGTFAHLSRKKGHRQLIRAAEIVLERLPTAQFWCVGEGKLRLELAHQARAAGIADRFRMLGFRRDVPDLMQAIDVMCLPSHREPFGLVYVEAALAGKPVIACHAGGAPEIIEHGETGLLVPPPCKSCASGKPHSGPCPAGFSRFGASSGATIAPLAEAILTLLENRAQAAAMGRRGRELALDRFGWNAYLRRLCEVYDSVRSAVPPPRGSTARRAA